MKAEEKLKSVKRFGARYGRKLKLKLSKIEEEQKKLHKCPYCHKIAVKRIAVGIWHCRKCNAKFTGKAYSVSKQIIPKEEKEPDEEEPKAEEEENYNDEQESSESNEDSKDNEQDDNQSDKNQNDENYDSDSQGEQ